MKARVVERMLWWVVLLVGLAPLAPAQIEPNSPNFLPTLVIDRRMGVITGRIMPPTGKNLGVNTKVTLRNSVNPLAIVNTGETGEFSFSDLAGGRYYLEVTVDSKVYNPLSLEVILKPNEAKTLTLYLEEKQVSFSEKSPKHVTSAEELAQQVPEAARKEYAKATKFIKKGQLEPAIAALQSALNIFPDYQMARNDLGAQYLKLKRYDEAIAEFRRVLAANPQAFNPRLNLGLALVSQNNYAAALPHLEQAISLDSGQPAAHLYCGIALLMTGQAPRAQEEIKKALGLGGDSFWLAHYYLALAYLRNGEREPAVRELQVFLERPSEAEMTTQARQLLAALQ